MTFSLSEVIAYMDAGYKKTSFYWARKDDNYIIFTIPDFGEITINKNRIDCFERQPFCACCLSPIDSAIIDKVTLNFRVRNHYGHLSTATIDHVIPRAKGGANTLDNMQTLCEPCNQLKGSKLISIEELQAKFEKKTGLKVRKQQ